MELQLVKFVLLVHSLIILCLRLVQIVRLESSQLPLVPLHAESVVSVNMLLMKANPDAHSVRKDGIKTAPIKVIVLIVMQDLPWAQRVKLLVLNVLKVLTVNFLPPKPVTVALWVNTPKSRVLYWAQPLARRARLDGLTQLRPKQCALNVTWVPSPIRQANQLAPFANPVKLPVRADQTNVWNARLENSVPFSVLSFVAIVLLEQREPTSPARQCVVIVLRAASKKPPVKLCVTHAQKLLTMAPLDKGPVSSANPGHRRLSLGRLRVILVQLVHSSRTLDPNRVLAVTTVPLIMLLGRPRALVALQASFLTRPVSLLAIRVLLVLSKTRLDNQAAHCAKVEPLRISMAPLSVKIVHQDLPLT